MEEIHMSIKTKEGFISIDSGIGLNKIDYNKMNKLDKLKILEEITFVKGITITQCLKDFDKCKKLNKTK